MFASGNFWAWINMGFWALTLNNQITTDLTLSGNVPPITVSVHMQEPHMAITDGAWTEDLGKALQAYRAQATEKVKSCLSLLISPSISRV